MRKLFHFINKINVSYGVVLLCILFILAGSLVSINRYWQYEAFYYDFGIFDDVICSVSRFQPPIIDHIAVGERVVFADHFYPSIFLLSPMYWFTDRSEVLLFIQAAAAGLSGLVLYYFAKDVLKNSYYALAIMVSYYLFVGLQNAVITDFHEVTIAVLPLMVVFFYLQKEKRIWYWLSLFLFLGFKESNFLVGIGIALAVFFLKPAWRKIAVLTLLVSLLWGVLSIKVIIPYFSEGRYVYSELPITFNPVSIAQSFTDNPVKLRTLFYSFSSFGFLPLLSPALFPLLLQDLYVRFYPPNMFLRWDLGLHYSALMAAIMGISSVYGFHFLTRHIRNKKILYGIAIVLIVNALFLYRFVLRGPFAMAYNPDLYTHTKDFAFLDKAVSKIPKDATVMAQNNLATRFSHQKVWLLQSDEKPETLPYYTVKKPDYIIFDNRPGQNPNNYFTVSNMQTFLDEIKSDRKYKIYYNEGDVYIFQRR